ncbi:MAG: hypothetical protein U5N55_07980 [Cypionkella sp.]|nr:hypothetical protein [Cypionkella sp.]
MNTSCKPNTELPAPKRTADEIRHDQWMLEQVDRWSRADYAKSAALALELRRLQTMHQIITVPAWRRSGSRCFVVRRQSKQRNIRLCKLV